MKIINHENFKLSKDIINIKYKEWIEFNLNFKVIDEKNVIREYNDKFNYRKFNKDPDNLCNNEYAEEKYSNLEVHSNKDIIDLYDYNKIYLSKHKENFKPENINLIAIKKSILSLFKY